MAIRIWGLANWARRAHDGIEAMLDHKAWLSR
jgi:hypothetical protein